MFVLNKVEEQDDTNTRVAYNKTKDKFIEQISKRFLDKSSFCRSKAIKVVRKLVE